MSRYGLKSLLCIFWNSSGVLYDRLLFIVTNSLRLLPTIVPITIRQRKVAGFFLLQDGARKDTKN